MPVRLPVEEQILRVDAGQPARIAIPSSHAPWALLHLLGDRIIGSVERSRSTNHHSPANNGRTGSCWWSARGLPDELVVVLGYDGLRQTINAWAKDECRARRLRTDNLGHVVSGM